MIITPLLKSIMTICITMAISPELQAQTAQWYQQYTPRYYYGNYYQHYQYPTHYQQARPTPATPQHEPVRQQAQNSQWFADFNKAWASAVKQGRPLVVLFVHHGCPECDRMDRTLSQPGAMDTLGSAVKARIEFTRNPDLITRLGVKFTPTFLVFSPASNSEVYREVGALSLERLRTLKPSIESLVTGPPRQTETRRGEAPASRESKDTSQATDHRSSATIVASI